MEQIKLQRTHDHKKWTDIYQSQLNLREQKMNVSKAPTSKQRIHVAKLIIATKFARIVKEKLKSKSFSCRKIANNIHPATDFANWDNDMWGTQLLCCLCSSPGLHGCVSCVTCNAIAHQLCLLKKQKFKLLVDSVEDAHLIENFKCRDCEQSIRDEGLYYKKCLSALQTQRTAILAGSIIEAGFKGRLGRLRYAKMKRSAIIIQSLVRKRRAKKVFYMWRRTELRVVRIEFDNLFPPKAKQKLFAMNSSSNVNVSNSVDSNHKIPSGYLVVTVIDPIKHLQIFRFERKLSHVSNEAILIPGISALMQVVATFYFRDPYQVISHSKQQTLLIGQVVLALRDTKEFLMTQQYENMKISKKTSWIPVDMKDPGEKSVIDMNLAVGDQNSDQSNIYMICLHTSPIPNSFMKINRSLNNEDNNSVIAPSNAHVSKHHSKNSRSSMVLSPNKYNQGGNPFQAIVDKVNHSKTAAGPNSPGSKTLAWAKPVGDTKPLPPISPGRSTTDRRGSFALLPSRPASAGGKAPATSEMNKSSSAVQRPVSAFETKKQSKAKILSEYTTIDIGNFLDETEHTCNIKYIPLNPVSNICAKAMGPPIDLLRKKPTLLAQRKVEVSAPNTGPKRSTKYWICLSDLWLYFFTGYGDSMCKMMVDVKDANAFIDMNKHKTHVLHVHFPDTRKWAFEFEDPAKAVKFVFAIGESQRAYKYKNSIFMPPPRSRHTKPLGFTCPIR